MSERDFDTAKTLFEAKVKARIKRYAMTLGSTLKDYEQYLEKEDFEKVNVDWRIMKAVRETIEEFVDEFETHDADYFGTVGKWMVKPISINCQHCNEDITDFIAVMPNAKYCPQCGESLK